MTERKKPAKKPVEKRKLAVKKATLADLSGGAAAKGGFAVPTYATTRCCAPKPKPAPETDDIGDSRRVC